MTITAMTLAVVGSWSYAGFLAEPAPPPPGPATTTTSPSSTSTVTLTSLKTPSTTPSEVAPPVVAPPVVDSPKPKVAPIPEPKDETTAAKSEPAHEAVTLGVSSVPLPTPTLYRSTDASGQVWEHVDPAYLASFVESRNRSIVIYTQAPAWPSRASRCYTGRCN